MRVIDALEGSPFNAYYRRKFERIIEKAGVREFDLSSDWQDISRRINSTMSFNIWGGLFGGVWAVYRGVPYAFVAILVVAASIAAPAFTDVGDSFFRFLPYSLGALFGLFGNSWLLTSYLGVRRAFSDRALAEQEARPGVLQPFLAICLLAITGVVAETPGNDLRALTETVPGQAQLEQSLASVEDDSAASPVEMPLPPGYERVTLENGRSYGLKKIQGGVCKDSLAKCGRFELISRDDCSELTANIRSLTARCVTSTRTAIRFGTSRPSLPS